MTKTPPPRLTEAEYLGMFVHDMGDKQQEFTILTETALYQFTLAAKKATGALAHLATQEGEASDLDLANRLLKTQKSIRPFDTTGLERLVRYPDSGKFCVDLTCVDGQTLARREKTVKFGTLVDETRFVETITDRPGVVFDPSFLRISPAYAVSPAILVAAIAGGLWGVCFYYAFNPANKPGGKAQLLWLIGTTLGTFGTAVLGAVLGTAIFAWAVLRILRRPFKAVLVARHTAGPAHPVPGPIFGAGPLA